MPTASAFSNKIGLIHDWWLKLGTPRSVYPLDGTLYMMLKKGSDILSWSGGDGEPAAKYGYIDALPGAGAAELSTAWANYTTTDTAKITITSPGAWYQVPHIDWRVLLLTNGQAFNAKEFETTMHPRRFAVIMSHLAWQNGGGAIARLAGSGASLTGTTLTIKNSRCMKLFEVGDRLQFSTTDGTSGALKAKVVTVSAKNHHERTLTVDTIAGGDGILDNDFVFFAASHNQNVDMFRGIAAWNPELHSEAITTLYGLVRATNVTRRAGFRFTTSLGDDPWDIVDHIMRSCKEEHIFIKDIFTTPRGISRLLAASRPTHLRLTERGQDALNMMSMRPMGYRGDTPMANDPKNMRYGVEGLEVVWPGRGKVRIYCDEYLVNIDAVAESDEIWRGLNVDEFVTLVNPGAPNWFSTDGNGPFYWVQGAERIGAVYGAIGQFAHLAPGNTIVASPNVTTS